MKSVTRLLGTGLCLLILAAPTLTVAAPALYRQDVIIVKFKPAVADAVGRAKMTTATGVTSLDRLHQRLGATGIKRTIPETAIAPRTDRFGLSNYFTVTVPLGTDILSAVNEYAADPNVEVAEPDYIMPIYATPNDPQYADQWTHFSLNDYDIDSDSAWNLEVGDSTVLVGVIDSGVKFAHEDLIASVWVNPGEDLDNDGVVYDPDDMNGIDDDGNGYVDDLIGYDFLSPRGGCFNGEDCLSVPDNNPDDFAGHGTHVAGIIAATTDNGLGVAGIAGGFRSKRLPGVKIMCLRAGWLANDGLGYVDMADCATAFNYAVNMGVSVVNCSWGSSGSLIWTAVENAIANGVLVCAAAGNDNSSVIGAVLDTAYGVMTVASLNRSNNRSGFSNYGTWVDISAPGEDITNTFGYQGVASYAALSGTSMASPTVAGVAALLKSHKPTLIWSDLDTLLRNHSDPNIYTSNPGFVGKLGSGRVNAFYSLSALSTADFTVDTTFGKVPLTVNFTNTSPNAPSGPYTYTFGDGGQAFTSDAAHTYSTPGIYSCLFTATGPSGPHTRTRPELIVIVQDTIRYESINLEIGGGAAIPVRLRNTHPMKEITLPFRLSGIPDIFIDSITRGPRTPGWTAQIVFDNRFAGQIAGRLSMGTASPVAAGDGIVGYLWVRSGYSNTAGQTKSVDSATYSGVHYLRLKSNWADFKPDFLPGTITIVAPPCNCAHQGDVNDDAALDVLDVVFCIDGVFSGGELPPTDFACPLHRGDYNCDLAFDVLDVVYAVDLIFQGGPPPCNPCVTP